MVWSGKSSMCFEPRENAEFYKIYRGSEINSLPNLEISIPPVVKFRLHDLTLYGDNWTLKVRHKQKFNRWDSEPKVLICSGRAKNTLLSFRMPARTLYKREADFIADLEVYGLRLHSSHVQAMPSLIKYDQLFKHLDEVEVIKHFNQARYEKVKDVNAALPSEEELREVA